MKIHLEGPRDFSYFCQRKPTQQSTCLLKNKADESLFEAFSRGRSEISCIGQKCLEMLLMRSCKNTIWTVPQSRSLSKKCASGLFSLGVTWNSLRKPPSNRCLYHFCLWLNINNHNEYPKLLWQAFYQIVIHLPSICKCRNFLESSELDTSHEDFC